MRVLITSMLLALCGQLAAQTPDLILYNGHIFTAVNYTDFVEALAIRGNKILATGTDARIRQMARAGTRQIDLQGKTVIPGFNDAHYHHGLPVAGYTIAFPPTGAPGKQVLFDSLKAAAARLPAGAWIRAGMDIGAATDMSIHRYSLDSISNQHPVLLQAYWGHGTILNTAGLSAMGIPLLAPDPTGGFLERNRETNVINGRLEEEAQVWPFNRAYSDDSLVIASLKQLSREATAFGITTIQLMCSSATPEQFAEWLPAASFPIRARLIRWGKTDDPARNQNSAALDARLAPTRVYLGGMKWMLDGTPLERGAWLQNDYADKRYWKGVSNYNNNEIGAMIRSAKSARKPLHFHAVGDRTITNLFNQLETIGTAGIPRIRIEHGDGLLPVSFERDRALKVIVVQNPSHLMLDSVMRTRWPKSLLSQSMPMKSLLRAGIPLAIGSDGLLNPFLNIQFACIHAVRPTEALTRAEAVIAYTRTAAAAEGKESSKGILAPGKLADLAVLSQNIFTIPLQQLPATYSVLTIVDGQMVHVAH